MAVNLVFTGDSNDAAAAIAKLERKYAELENKLAQVGRKSKQSADDGAAAFLKFGMSVTGVGGAVDIATRAIGLMRAEYDALIDRQDKAKDANIDFAGALTNLALNTDQPLAKVKSRLMGLVEAAKMAPADIARILNEAQAAKGQLDESVVDPTIVAASKLARFQPETMKQLVGVSLDIQKQIEGTTPEQAIGFALNASAKSRVADPGEFNRNVMPGIIGVNKLDGTSMDYGAALSAGITQAAGDTTGRKSRTAMTALALQLREAFPELKDTQERVEMLQDNPEIRDAFLKGGKYKDKSGKEKSMSKMQFDVQGPDGETLQLDTDRASFERQMVPAMEQVLTKGSFAAKMMEESLATVPKLKDSGASFEERAKGMAEDSSLQVADIANNLKTSKTTAEVKNTAGAKESIARVDVDKLLAAEGIGYMERQMIGTQAWAESGKKNRFESTRDVLTRSRDASMYESQEAARFGNQGDVEKENARVGAFNRVLKSMGGPEEPAVDMNAKAINDRPDMKRMLDNDKSPADGGGEVAALTKEMAENNKLLAENNKLLGKESPTSKESPSGRTINRNGNREG